MNDYRENMPRTRDRDAAERHIDGIRQQGGIFVEAVRLTRMPMLVTDATLPGNPITFANEAFVNLSGYSIEELLGQDPHFMNGEETEPAAIERYQRAIVEGRDDTLEIVQHRKDGTAIRTMLFASPLTDGQGTVTNHFLSYLDITRRHVAEEGLRTLAAELEGLVTARTRELEAANERLRSLIVEREMLLVEVNHRAKNSLTIAGSLLAIQGRRQQDEGVRALFREAYERLNAMARVHDLLSKSESAQCIDAGTYVSDLCGALQPITENDKRISLRAEVAEGVLIGADKAVPVGILLTELITNAVKYAYPSPTAGIISVQVKPHTLGWVELVVEDGGVGMREIRQGSLGFGIVRSLVQQIGGEMTFSGAAGVTVMVRFPDGHAPKFPGPAGIA